MARVPHNLRQVGNPEGNLSIYIEDYVFTYLKSEYNTQAAILIGESCYGENGIQVFVRGAICCPQLFWQDEGMHLSQRTWNYILRERDHLFPNQEIVGWYMPLPQKEEKTLVAAGEFHGRNFPGATKVFFYLDKEEGEDAFFAKDGQVFKRQSGYYIFYEKNTAMREYMLALRQERQLEADLFKEVHDLPRENTRYREFLNAELEKRKDVSSRSGYLFGTIAIAAVVLVVVGLGIGDRKFEKVEAVLQTIIGRFGDEPSDSGQDDEVENIISDQNDDEQKDGSDNQSDVDGNSSSDDAQLEDGQGGAQEEGQDSAEDGMQGESNDNDDSLIEDTQFDTEVDEEATIIAMSLAQGYYVVRQGEGLSQICCKLYGDDSKLEEICEKNNIEDPNTIYPGQIIYLP